MIIVILENLPYFNQQKTFLYKYSANVETFKLIKQKVPVKWFQSNLILNFENS